MSGFWSAGFWATGFWATGFWGEEIAVTPAPTFGAGGGTGGGSWPRPWKQQQPIEETEALHLMGMI